jgi:uncharacterized protein with NRDE domain
MPLLLAANRDEFHARQAAPAGFWEDQPDLLAGRDLEAGGTWLGLSRRGRFAAITNIRDPRAGERRAARSRGDLTRDFLAGSESPRAYLESVATRIDDYLGFNLLVGDGDALWYLHGSPGSTPEPAMLKPGIYALSNAALDVPWPKVELARKKLTDLLSGAQAPGHSQLRNCVSDRSLAEAAALAELGLEGEMTRQLSAQFIVTPRYGTRCSTTLRWAADGQLELEEQRFDVHGHLAGSESFSLAVDTGP